MMENKSTGYSRMGINYNGSQGQTEKAVVLQEEEEGKQAEGRPCYST
jgi:hypothetical protein